MTPRAVVAIVLAVGPFAGAALVQADELKLHANRVYLPVTINGQKA